MSNGKIKVSPMLDRFEQICRNKGLRITHQRVEIFKALLQHDTHPTVEQVFEQVRRRLTTISLDTVYRTISTFEEYGLVRKVYHIDNAARLDVNISDHHHLVCKKCHAIEDFYWPDFDRMKPPKSIAHWQKLELKHVVISGLCSNCKTAR